jgi:hypothetical protein
MTSLVRIRPLLRLAAFVAALCALLAPATAGASVHAHAAAKKKAKPPVVTSVRPMNVEIGQTLEIRGKYFIRGRYKNTVAFKRDGGKAVFAKAKIGTTKLLRITVPAKLKNEFKKSGYFYVPTRFRIRVLSKKFGKKFTALSKSPLVALKPGTSPVAVAPPALPANTSAEGDCDHDGLVNSKDADDDNDLLPDSLENAINATLLAKYGPKVNPLMNTCSNDSDGDGVEDGYEYQSARDLNDDEYQSPNTYLPYPGKKPYANPLDKTDANTDHDGDSLTLLEEQKLWKYVYTNEPGNSRKLEPLTYSDGMQYSVYIRNPQNNNRREPALKAVGYDRQAAFEKWLHDNSGYEFVELPDQVGPLNLLDANRDGKVWPEPGDPPTQPGYLHSERYYLDTHGPGYVFPAVPDHYLSDDERDEDADGLSNFVESHGPMSDASWWNKSYDREHPFLPVVYAGTDLADEDSDGDLVRDGADDQDHDDIPNLMELSRNMATGRPFDDPKTDKAAGDPSKHWGRVNPFNPCLPDTTSRTCPSYTPFGTSWAPFDGTAYDPQGDDPDYLVRN